MTAYKEEQVKDLSKEKFHYLLVETKDHVLTLTLNRPKKKNAMNPQFMREIVFALNHAKYNKYIWVVVLQANGDIYTAGADLKAFAGQTTEDDSTIPETEEMPVLGDAFKQLNKPCIAKVHANVYAGGHLLICGCTHVLAAEQALFSLPEVRRGIWPMQVMASLAPLMNERELLDYCMRGKTIGAEKAKELNLVTQVSNKDCLDNDVNELVEELKTFSPSAIRLGLKAWHEMKEINSEKQHGYLLNMLQEILQTKDAGEGLQAFMEKREPKWTGE
ncbi:MAG: enoyl-CoA hydratase-related protein [Chitinophagales bacterium]